MAEERGFIETCIQVWNETWEIARQSLDQSGDIGEALQDEALVIAIRQSINNPTKTYRYVLPTQLIAKFVNPELDAKCIQVQRGGQGAFDARTVAHGVIVPFEKQNHNVLGGAPEPYVNNPLRVPEISLDPQIRGQQKNKQGWDYLFTVLNRVQGENNPEFTFQVLKQVQTEIARRLALIRVIYPIPKRISLERTKRLLIDFLATPSGGDRYEVVAMALFQTIGRRFSLYSDIQRNKTNAPDTASGQVADIECKDENGNIMLAVEVKDRLLQINHIADKISTMRERSVSEILYLVREGISQDQIKPTEDRIRHEFASGQNIYVFDLLAFTEVICALIGEEGRHEFMEDISEVLEKYSSPLSTRQCWADLLSII
jgi:hypothetical protein